MAAYLIATIHAITDPERFSEYRRHVGASIAEYDGKYVTGHHPVERLEGDWQPFGITVVEFESAERIREWYNSDTYQELLRIREGAGKVDIFIVEGA